MVTEVLPLGGFGKPSGFGLRQSLPERLYGGRKAVIALTRSEHFPQCVAANATLA
jgi:hypothetical protein